VALVPESSGKSVTASTRRLRDQSDEERAARDRLRQAQAALAEEQQRFDHLAAAQERAHDSLRRAHGALADAQDALTKARHAEPADLAWTFAAGQPTLGRRPPQETEAQVKLRQGELDHLNEITAALESELTQVEARLRRHETAVTAALSTVVAASTEFQRLVGEHDAAWLHLRSVRVALTDILTACAGNLSSDLYGRIQAVQPLEERVGHPVKPFVGDWQTAVVGLRHDANTPLPGDVT
jgi:hypothetical protein